MAQLAASIEKHDILKPLLVRPSNSSYKLVAGERRYRAAYRIGTRNRSRRRSQS